MYYNGDVQAYLKDETIRKNIRDNANRTLLIDKQAEHMKDSPKYKQGKSYLSISNEEIQDIVSKFAGTGKIERTINGNFANKERIVLDKVVGVSINNKTGIETETRIIKIHYRKTGVHIVPTMEGSEKL